MNKVRMNKVLWLSVALALLIGGMSPAAQRSFSDDDAQAQDDGSAPTRSGGNPDVVDKRRFENYLRSAVAKIKQQDRARTQFFDAEATGIKKFWSKITEDRQVFEVRITRQMLDTFESMASLDPKDRPSTVANFDKLLTEEIRSFDQQQHEKIQGFFATRDQRWKEFATEQDRERTQFIVDAADGWQQQKAALQGGAERRASDEPPAKPSKPAKTSKPTKPTKPPKRTDSEWSRPSQPAFPGYGSGGGDSSGWH